MHKQSNVKTGKYQSINEPAQGGKENTRTMPRIKYKKAKLRNELQKILGKQ